MYVHSPDPGKYSLEFKISFMEGIFSEGRFISIPVGNENISHVDIILNGYGVRN